MRAERASPIHSDSTANPQLANRGRKVRRFREVPVSLFQGDRATPLPEVSDQVIREDPAVRSSYVRGRGTETSAEVLVGPPWRM